MVHDRDRHKLSIRYLVLTIVPIPLRKTDGKKGMSDRRHWKCARKILIYNIKQRGKHCFKQLFRFSLDVMLKKRGFNPFLIKIYRSCLKDIFRNYYIRFKHVLLKKVRCTFCCVIYKPCFKSICLNIFYFNFLWKGIERVYNIICALSL